MEIIKTAGDSLEQKEYFTLRPYQTRALEFLSENASSGGSALFVPAGLGKTAVMLIRFMQSGYRRMLYVGPKRVAASVPSNELPKWAELEGLEVRVVEGDAEQRIEALQYRAEHPVCFTIAYHNLAWLVKSINEGKLKIPAFNLIAFDESSFCKNPQTKTFKSAFALSKYAKEIIASSGTPSAQGVVHLWAQMVLCDGGATLGKSFNHFLNEYFTKTKFGHHALPGAQEKILAAIKSRAFSLVASDWLDLPPVTRRTIEVGVSQDLREVLDSAAAGEAFSVTATSIEGEEVDLEFGETDIPPRMAMRAWQLGQGFIKLDEDSYQVHDEKLDALVGLLEELGDEQLIVAHHFQHDRAAIIKRLAAEGVTGVEVLNSKDAQALQSLLKRWQARQIRVLLLNPKSGGHGLDGLQKTGSNLCWYGIQWSVEAALQTEARLIRSGQTKPVFIHTILNVDSIDPSIVRAIESGANGNEALIQALAYRSARAAAAAGASAEQVEEAVQKRMTELRRAMQRTHPDHGGTGEAFIRARRAFNKFKAEQA